MREFVVVVVMVAVGASCVPLCTPGTSAPCSCADGRAGSQQCRLDGHFDACACSGPLGGGGFGTGGGFATGGGFGGTGGGFGVTGGGGSSDGPMLVAPEPPHIVVGDPFVLFVKEQQQRPETSLTWSWTLVAAPPDAGSPLADGTTSRPVFTATVPGPYQVQVRASNDAGEASLVIPIEVGEGQLFTDLFSTFAVAPQGDVVALGYELPSRVVLRTLQTGQEQSVPVSRAPRALAFTLDGTKLVVGQDAQLQVISLVGTPAVTATWPISVNVAALTASDTHAYFVDTTERDVGWLRLDSGETGSRYFFYSVGGLRMHPSARRFYAGNRGVSPDDVLRFSIGDGGVVSDTADSRYHGDYPTCGDAWLTRDGALLVSACGVVFRTAELRVDDLVYGGALPMTRLESLDESRDASRWFGLAQPTGSFPDYLPGAPSFLTFDRTTLRQLSARSLPNRVSSVEGRLEAQWLFVDERDQVHVVLATGAGAPVRKGVWLVLDGGAP
ncbi:MAG: PKD domain-containing protein [Myxococcota bacterium]